MPQSSHVFHTLRSAHCARSGKHKSGRINVSELSVLFFIATISIVGVVIQHVSNISVRGLSFAFAPNRPDDFKNGFLARAGNALRNGIESGAMMGPLVLIIIITETSNEISQLAAMAYIITRIGYHIFYWAGQPKPRSVLWGLSMLSIFAMASVAVSAL